jgi:hypothetical protein
MIHFTMVAFCGAVVWVLGLGRSRGCAKIQTVSGVLKLSDFRGKKTVVLAFFVAAFTGSLCHLGAPCYICCF